MFEPLITLGLLALEKSAEMVLILLLQKFWKWLFSDRHLQRASNFLRMQILILYLDWVLQKTPLKSPPAQSEKK